MVVAPNTSLAPASSTVRLAAVEPVYGTVIQLARLVWRAQGLKFTVSGWRTCPSPAVPWWRSTTPVISTSPSPACPPTCRSGPQGPLHGQAGGLRPQGHRSDHAQPAPHPGGPRQRCGLVRCGLPGAQGRRTGRRLPRGDHQPQLRAQGVQVRCRADGHRRRRADHPAHRLGRSAHLDQGPPEEDVAAQGSHRDRGGRADPADVAAHRADRAAPLPYAASARAGAGRLRPLPAWRVLGAQQVGRGRADAGAGGRTRSGRGCGEGGSPCAARRNRTAG